MKYCGISPKDGRDRKKFRCPITAASKKERSKFPAECPINHKCFCSGKSYGCTTYTVENDLRKKVPRESAFFKKTYRKRTEVERYFSRMGDREAEQTTHFRYRSIRNQMTIAHLTLALNAVAAVLILKRPDKIRCFKSLADAA